LDALATLVPEEAGRRARPGPLPRPSIVDEVAAEEGETATGELPADPKAPTLGP